MRLKMYVCCNKMLVLSICCALVKGSKDLPGPDNVQVNLEFVNSVPLITVTWDPPLIIGLPNNTKINSYEVAIFNLNKTADNQQVQETRVVDNQTTSWNISNVALSAKYYASVRVNYTTGYSEAINSSSIGVTFLQNFTTSISGNQLRATCDLAKSDVFVDCQLVILNIKESSEVLSPVNIAQSNFSILLPSSEDEFLVTARAVDIYGDAVDTEIFNVSYIIAKTITPTPDSTNPSYSAVNRDTEMCDNTCTMLTPLAIWLIIIILLIILIIVISLIIITLHRSGICRPKKKPLSKRTMHLASVPPANDSELTCSPPISNLLLNNLLSKSKDNLPLKSEEGPPLESQEYSLLRTEKDPPVKSQEDPIKKSYENLSIYPKPSNVRHSHIEIQECPAYKALRLSGDYDDICSTAVVMQPNPSYKDNVFSHNT